MKTRMLSLLIGFSGFALASPLTAHQEGRHGYVYGGVSGSVSISTGAYYGPAFNGTVSFGSPRIAVPAYYPPPVYYPQAIYYPSAVYYPQMIYYPACGHRHPPGHDHGHGYAYPQSYADGGYERDYKRGYKHGRGRHD